MEQPGLGCSSGTASRPPWTDGTERVPGPMLLRAGRLSGLLAGLPCVGFVTGSIADRALNTSRTFTILGMAIGVAGSRCVAYVASGGTGRGPARRADRAQPPARRPTTGAGPTWAWNRWWREGARGLLSTNGAPRVLVVEPEPEVLDTLRGSLTREGFHVLGTHSALESVKRLEREEDPDLALIDLALPDINPHDLLIALRSRCGSHLPAAFLSRTPTAPPRLGDHRVLRPPFRTTRPLALIDEVAIGHQSRARRHPDRVMAGRPHRDGGTINGTVPAIRRAGDSGRAHR